MFSRFFRSTFTEKSIRNALLVASNPIRIGDTFQKIQHLVSDRLYVHILPNIVEPYENHYSYKPSEWSRLSPILYHIYSQATIHCPNLDVRVLLTHLKHEPLRVINSNHRIDSLMFDQFYSKNWIESFIAQFVTNKDIKLVRGVDSGRFSHWQTDLVEPKGPYKHTLAAGAFDRLHNAHKYYLSEAALRSSFAVTVGVSEERLLQAKLLSEIIEDVDVRMAKVKDFISDVCTNISVNVVPLSETFYPLVNDPSAAMIVISEDQLAVSDTINTVRHTNSLPTLDIVVANLLPPLQLQSDTNPKFSSTRRRIDSLGTVVRPIRYNHYIKKKPYIIGLTGKTFKDQADVSQMLAKLGGTVIDCDKIEQKVLDGPAYESVKRILASEVKDFDQAIDKQCLAKMQEYHELVWPLMTNEIATKIQETKESILILKSSHLSEAGWEMFCHEIWCSIHSKGDERHSYTQQDDSIVDAERFYPGENYYAKRANVVVCTLWGEESTQEQVNRAWKLLKKRLP